MRYIASILLLLLLASPMLSFAQRDREDKKEEYDEKKAAGRDRVDFTVFRRQIITLPEFSEQRKKLAEWKKEGRGIGKIYAVVDSMNDNADANLLTGYIQLVLADNTANVYEVAFNRTTKKITEVKLTGETIELEPVEESGAKNVREKSTKPAVKPAPKKKKSEDDDDDEEEEEKPAKGKQNEEDD